MSAATPARRLVMIGFLAAALVASCSHQQKLTTTAVPSTAAAAPAPKPRPRTTVADVADTDMSKTKEDMAIYFDFDSSLLRDDARPVLRNVADEVKGRNTALRIEGNCDEIGTVEYNLALGEQRARAAKEYLVHMGVAPDRVAIASYGSQRPKFQGHDESAHAKNRRDDLLVR
jgi:peptidoglycan-associated lipoprotein